MLIEAGRADLLIGQSERSWLECKAAPYAETEYGRLELAKDVAGIANTSSGGILVIGLRTRTRAGQDLIRSVHPIPHVERLPDRYRKWISQRVFPPPEELAVRIAAMPGNCGLLVLVVPQQPSALQPFLVRGATIDRNLLGTYISVYSRRDDAVVASSAEELHSLIVAGRAALGYRREDV
jgi:hypothetical protein